MSAKAHLVVYKFVQPMISLLSRKT